MNNINRTINSFRDEHYFLSNFYYSKGQYRNLVYSNNEAAFQAQKTLDISKRKDFTFLNPSMAKKAGRYVKLRENWEEIKEEEMYFICLAKFQQNPDIAKKLIETYPAELVEGNVWNDMTWGVCNGKGENLLGKILMDVRDRLSTAGGKTHGFNRGMKARFLLFFSYFCYIIYI